ncbi:MAG: hypothetical protein LBU65_08525 [Planctomycetaceae bacterium]|jgi:hypothetical protein|nr:hypothetical protein [Planctomycetaceae bacterium]
MIPQLNIFDFLLQQIFGDNNVKKKENAQSAKTDLVQYREEFAKKIIDLVRRSQPTMDITYDADNYMVKCNGTYKQQLFLRNGLYEYANANGDSREDIVKRWASHFINARMLPEDFEDVKPDLLPAIHLRTFHDFMSLYPQHSELHPNLEFPYEILAEHFAVGLSYDMHDTVAMVPPELMNGWEITFYEGMEIAKENLAEKGFSYEQLEVTNPNTGAVSRMYIVPNSDGYEAARLLLTTTVRKLEVNGDPIAMILAANSLMITGSEDTSCVACMLMNAVEAGNGFPRQLAPMLLRLNEADQWEVWLPPTDSPCYTLAKQIQITAYFRPYAEQRLLINSFNERTYQPKIEIAEYRVRQGNAQNCDEYCCIKPDTRQLIPRTDYVVFGDYNEKQTPPVSEFVEREKAFGLLTDYIKETDYYPVLYQLEPIPTEVFEKMRMV